MENDEPSAIPDGSVFTPESAVALIWISSVVLGPLILMYSKNPEHYNTLLRQLPRALAIGLGLSSH